MGNHFTSQASDKTGSRRRVQAAEVAAIVNDLRKRTPWIMVAGDLNDHPGSGNLDALVQHPELTDAMALPLYQGRPGTYKTAGASQKIDYLFVSQRLKSKVKKVDVNRRGYFSIAVGAARRTSGQHMRRAARSCGSSATTALWADVDALAARWRSGAALPSSFQVQPSVVGQSRAALNGGVDESKGSCRRRGICQRAKLDGASSVFDCVQWLALPRRGGSSAPRWRATGPRAGTNGTCSSLRRAGTCWIVFWRRERRWRWPASTHLLKQCSRSSMFRPGLRP
ncbi:MAG: hypothetical protein MZW92_31555 [Comamonadaceae bacterium]|nr:hypothetical protein [Comamonadaceae bacterium]